MIDFPSSPAVGTEVGGTVAAWQWNGYGWVRRLNLAPFGQSFQSPGAEVHTLSSFAPTPAFSSINYV